VNRPPKRVEKWIQTQLFDTVPMAMAVIDAHFEIVYANQAFDATFGQWQGRRCHDVYLGRKQRCRDCVGTQAFQTRKPQVSKQSCVDRDGNQRLYIKHTLPVIDEQGQVPFLVEMCTDVTESDQIKREYQLLFDQVPCNILIIDRDFRIVKTNAQASKIMGNLVGHRCYKGLKGLDEKCVECTARQTFEDGSLHTGHHLWRTLDGETRHLHVITVPILQDDGSFETVMEMAVDVTKTLRLEDGLKFAHSFLETLITTAMDGIFALDESGEVRIVNPAARKLFNLSKAQNLSRDQLNAILPAEFWDQVRAGQPRVYFPETTITCKDGSLLPVRLSGNKLNINNKSKGMAFSIQDLSEIKRLEADKLEAERLAAVGQTVAGLAHGIKNLTTALEGGLYLLNSGVGKGDIERIQKGMEMLGRNIERITMFVKAFLSFAKGREIRAKCNPPQAIAKEVTDMYVARAQQSGISLAFEADQKVAPAVIDYESMHECLTNLVGNAIDACQVSENGGSHVTVRLLERKGAVIYEVEDDGCGMDYELKRKLFTTFFTTKGLGGTGLGLLMTKKIVHEHGGTIELESEPKKGTVFRIVLPRHRLPQPIEGADCQ
jgi:PAS domain S-box-containing protein